MQESIDPTIVACRLQLTQLSDAIVSHRTELKSLSNNVESLVRAMELLRRQISIASTSSAEAMRRELESMLGVIDEEIGLLELERLTLLGSEPLTEQKVGA